MWCLIKANTLNLNSWAKYNCQSGLKIQMSYIFAGAGFVGINIHAMKVSIHNTNWKQQSTECIFKCKQSYTRLRAKYVALCHSVSGPQCQPRRGPDAKDDGTRYSSVCTSQPKRRVYPSTLFFQVCSSSNPNLTLQIHNSLNFHFHAYININWSSKNFPLYL